MREFTGQSLVRSQRCVSVTTGESLVKSQSCVSVTTGQSCQITKLREGDYGSCQVTELCEYVTTGHSFVRSQKLALQCEHQAVNRKV